MVRVCDCVCDCGTVTGYHNTSTSQRVHVPPPVILSYHPLLHHSYMSHFNTSHITTNTVYTSVAAFQGKDFFKNTSVAAEGCLSRISPEQDIYSHLTSFPIAMVAPSSKCKHTATQ